jgi:hypothetical protein
MLRMLRQPSSLLLLVATLVLVVVVVVIDTENSVFFCNGLASIHGYSLNRPPPFRRHCASSSLSASTTKSSAHLPYPHRPVEDDEGSSSNDGAADYGGAGRRTTTNITTTQTFLIHQGRSEGILRRSPSIAGVSLVRGWTESTTIAFVAGVHALGTRIQEQLCVQ